MALNVTRRAHLTNEQLYQDLSKVTEKIQQRRMRIAGHCIRHSEEPVCQLVLWQSVEGRISKGRKWLTYVENLLQDSGMANIDKLRACIGDCVNTYMHACMYVVPDWI
uniref:Uncharacterized protein n=1 Tax=Octopus bimaculoides TaxID=37653 RepID=A0A0L8GJ36_OCTBM